MVIHAFKIALFTLTALLLSASSLWSNTKADEKHVEVSMRLIGHELLLSSGDSLSRIMPIQKSPDGKYQIEFENDFSFKPVELNGIVSAIMAEKKIAEHFLVEVMDCQTSEIVYAYEEGMTDTSTVLPCGVREQPKGCYSLLITLLDMDSDKDLNMLAGGNPKEEKGDNRLAILLLVSFGIFVAIVAYIRKRGNTHQTEAHIISIGRYQFDQRNMALTLDNEKVELTSKEADLLTLLYSSANQTLEHDHILKAVWGSNGDYVGRTLDVFISKLRKKLNADTTVKIVNIRGVGYKLVLNG